MEWRDEGVLLSVRPHGETSAIIEVLTAAHGRHEGVVRGGSSRRTAPILQPGAQLDLTWRARLDEHIGTFAVEPLKSRSSALSDRLALAGLNAVCALLHLALPERLEHAEIYRRTVALLDGLGTASDWAQGYLLWELFLLEDLGYGLDLSSCAVSGSREDLAYVSPRTGRAVARSAAGEWADRLLPLPPCLLGQGTASRQEIVAGLRTTGHFLQRMVGDHAHRLLPAARARLVALLARSEQEG